VVRDRQDVSSSGIVELSAVGTVEEAAHRLECLLRARGLKLFARIDQAAEARAFGLDLRPTVLFLFGDARTGTPLMQRYPGFALDLPLKALVWEADDGSVRLTYNAPEYFQHRHGMSAPPFGGLAGLMRQAAQASFAVA